MLHRLRLPDKGPGPGIITHCHSERQYLSFRAEQYLSFRTAARNLEEKDGTTDREQAKFVSY